MKKLFQLFIQRKDRALRKQVTLKFLDYLKSESAMPTVYLLKAIDDTVKYIETGQRESIETGER